MHKTLKSLENWIQIVQKSILVLAGIEVLIVLIIGVASNNIGSDNIHSSIWLSILFILGFLYITITLIKIAYNKSFPISIVQELVAKEELQLSKQEVSRKDAIHNYISNTIIALSNCKCEIPTQNELSNWKSDSDKDFLNGAKSVFSIFNSVINLLLNTTNFKFTIGIYIESFRAISRDNLPEENKGIFLVRDDFELDKSGIIRDLMDSERPAGIELEIQNLVKVSLHNGLYKTKKIKVRQGRKVLLICSNIKDLKKNEQKGVLFIITDTVENLPDDIEAILKVFTNILSHWTDLYEHEVIRRQIQIMGEEVEENEQPAEIELQNVNVNGD